MRGHRGYRPFFCFNLRQQTCTFPSRREWRRRRWRCWNTKSSHSLLTDCQEVRWGCIRRMKTDHLTLIIRRKPKRRTSPGERISGEWRRWRILCNELLEHKIRMSRYLIEFLTVFIWRKCVIFVLMNNNNNNNNEEMISDKMFILKQDLSLWLPDCLKATRRSNEMFAILLFSRFAYLLTYTCYNYHPTQEMLY